MPRERFGITILLIGSFLSLCGAVFFEFTLNLVPCFLCRMQQMIFLVAFFVAISWFVIQGRWQRILLMILMYCGCSFAFYQVLLEIGVIATPRLCAIGKKITDPVVEFQNLMAPLKSSCKKPLWFFLGLSIADWNMIWYSCLMSTLFLSPKNASLTPPQEINISRMVRVDHAGEYGATYIYKGQRAVLGHTNIGPELQHMQEQEEEHFQLFLKEILARRIRPSALMPLWQCGGYALGFLTGLMGKKAAMACTVAVEDAIDTHYATQEDILKKTEEKALYTLIKKCRADEQEHRETSLSHGAEQAFGYPILYKAIRGLSEIAIKVAQRI